MNIKESKKIYIHYGNSPATSHFDPSLFGAIKNRHIPWTKPDARSGLWGSPVDSEWGWRQWNESEKYVECNDEESFKFRLKPGNKVLTLKTKSDIEGIPELGTTGFPMPILGDEYHPDFEKLASMIDAIEIEDIAPFYMSLYGWDCESILVLNPYIIEEVK